MKQTQQHGFDWSGPGLTAREIAHNFARLTSESRDNEDARQKHDIVAMNPPKNTLNLFI